MKKTCNGCRAISRDFCYLGYATKIIYKDYKDFSPITILIPLEKCPKPKTYNEYFLQMKLSKDRISGGINGKTN